MEYLDPADGWTPLQHFIGDWDVLQVVAMEAPRSLQSCLGGKAVHGDLHARNLLIRYALGKCSSHASTPKLHGRFECVM